MGTGKKKIEIKRKEKETDRLVAFSKRRRGLFKKAHQLHSLSAAHVAVLVFSPAGKIYIYGDPCFADTIDKFLYNATSPNPLLTHTNSSAACDHDADDAREDFQEMEALKAWLETLNVDTCDDVNDLLSVKNDLQQIRDRLIQRMSVVADSN
ncbi:hypothetical protein DCAR_0206471 [Daucus carota subsp. sativus]|uniref:MADS-box domain-containing protein n=1 Tax=Daucus carota subsp. sativus TaxID=79200 RepID=A0AAF0WFL5_DAUCS|nr:PREDICTED: agamous-like MADS-box protein AGL11 [Daucus carota subsp. sativus]WOG87248.1 hypothetical protein DCAR_0206471 [Daucus carota subsp. sativus]